MSAKTQKVLSMQDFIAKHGALKVFKSKADNYYALDSEGEFVGMLADDFDKKKPAVVFFMANEETGETWKFIANGTPREPEFTLE